MESNQVAEAELPDTDDSALDRLKRFGGATLLGKMIALFLTAAPERIQAAAERMAASSRRALIGCATCTTWPSASVLKTRHSPLSAARVVNPSCACCSRARPSRARSSRKSAG